MKWHGMTIVDGKPVNDGKALVVNGVYIYVMEARILHILWHFRKLGWRELKVKFLRYFPEAENMFHEWMRHMKRKGLVDYPTYPGKRKVRLTEKGIRLCLAMFPRAWWYDGDENSQR